MTIPSMVASEPPAVAGEICVTNPATGEAVGSVPRTSRSEVAALAARGREAQARWEAVGWRSRAAVIRRFHDLILARADEVLNTIQSESGKARRDALTEVVTVAGTARYYLAHGRRHLAEERRRAAVPGLTAARVRFRPHGLVGLITPWNYPFLLGVADALPALLAGNAVLTKPAEATPLSTILARELLVAAGLDPKLFQVVTGAGSEVGEALIDQVNYLGFTGSTETGRRVARRAGERLIPFSLELGGKNPMVVLAGAPLDATVEGLVSGAYSNSGQTCISIERVYVEDGIYDEFVRRARARVSGLKLGWSAGWDVDMGSLISAEHVARVSRHVEEAAARGAQVLAGGRKRTELGPAFFEPTLLAGVDDSMAVAKEETFGPVVSVYRVRDAAEAVARANESEFGLNASLWAGGGSRAWAVARNLAAGSVGINSTLLIYNTFDVPMGGIRASGIGRRHGSAGILRYVQAQSVVKSFAAGGGYESIPGRMTSAGRARALLTAFRLWRHFPGLR